VRVSITLACMDDTYSVSDLARAVARGRPLAPVLDRVRNWARAGYLRPIGDQHPGTGYRRRFDRGALMDAVLLDALTSLAAMPAPRAITTRVVFRHLLALPENLTDQLFFVVTAFDDGTPLSALKEVSELGHFLLRGYAPVPRTHTVVPVAPLLKQVRDAIRAKEQSTDADDPEVDDNGKD
jgi:hypothetical protein